MSNAAGRLSPDGIDAARRWGRRGFRDIGEPRRPEGGITRQGDKERGRQGEESVGLVHKGASTSTCQRRALDSSTRPPLPPPYEGGESRGCEPVTVSNGLFALDELLGGTAAMLPASAATSRRGQPACFFVPACRFS